MSEPLAERLSCFTPDGSALNRDALLFAAGRASVRPSRHWQALAAVLAASQLFTLVSLWPRTPTPAPINTPTPMAESSIPADPFTPALTKPSEVEAYSVGLLRADMDRPTAPSDKPLIPTDPPLYAFGNLASNLTN